MNKNVEKAILNYFKECKPMPKDVEAFGRLASWDLYCGPLTYCEECGVDHLSDCTCDLKYPGFQKACDIVSQWVSENVHDLYVECDSDCVMTSEPEGRYVDENGDDCDSEADNAEWQDPNEYWLVEAKDIITILFDKELVSYVY